jgi:hypothetical protein
MNIEQIREFLKEEIDNYIDAAPSEFSDSEAQRATTLDHLNNYIHFLATLINIHRNEKEKESEKHRCTCADIVFDECSYLKAKNARESKYFADNFEFLQLIASRVSTDTYKAMLAELDAHSVYASKTQKFVCEVSRALNVVLFEP